MNIDTALSSLLGLFGLWIVVNYLWRDFRNDAFREDIFSVRDEMFLYAAQNKISFEDPAYTWMRGRMNGLLRHGHGLTLTRLLLLATICQDMNPPASLLAWEFAVEKLPSEVRDKLREFNLRTSIYVLQHVVYYSFFRYLLLRPLAIRVEVRKVIAKPKVVYSVEQLESATLEEEALADPVPA
jgi:hypothetical protein